MTSGRLFVTKFNCSKSDCHLTKTSGGKIIELYDESVEMDVQDNFRQIVHPTKQGHKIYPNIFGLNLKTLSKRTYCQNIPDLSIDKCTENNGRGFGRVFVCDFAKCAKRKDLVQLNKEFGVVLKSFNPIPATYRR